MINIHRIETGNRVNGDGNRMVIWLQGCTLGCPDCWNKHLWSNEPRQLFSTAELIRKIDEHAQHIDGITLTGGEPLEQAEELLLVVKYVKEQLDLSVYIFSGFEWDEINHNPAHHRLLAFTDILISGRFDSKYKNNNQTIHYLNPSTWQYNNQEIQIDIDADGSILITGYPDDQLICEMQGVLI